MRNLVGQKRWCISIEHERFSNLMILSHWHALHQPSLQEKDTSWTQSATDSRSIVQKSPEEQGKHSLFVQTLLTFYDLIAVSFLTNLDGFREKHFCQMDKNLSKIVLHTHFCSLGDLDAWPDSNSGLDAARMTFDWHQTFAKIGTTHDETYKQH